jgi:DNA-binding MarR family transcriptional regulator
MARVLNLSKHTIQRALKTLWVQCYIEKYVGTQRHPDTYWLTEKGRDVFFDDEAD